MRNGSKWMLAAALAACGTAHAQGVGDYDGTRADGRTDMSEDASGVIGLWPEHSRLTARALIEKYGAPDGVTEQRVFWNDRGEWTQVTAFREGAKEDFPTTHRNVVENTVRYAVPPGKAGELTKFHPSLIVHETTGTLAARSDSEQANILALNLADEIVRGKRDVDSARDHMRSTLRRYKAGKSSKYTDGLLFPVPDRQPR